MSRLLKLVAALLAAVWLPATLHCQLESAGFKLFTCADQAGDATDDGTGDCADVGCQTLESGQVVVSKVRLDVALPPVFADAGPFCLFELRAPEPAVELIAVRQDETLPLRRTWQFEHRAAPPARAPGVPHA